MQHRLRYLFIDFNAYFASVEQHDEPALIGRPVLVAPLKSEYTSAIAVSYEARKYGIRRGTPVREARQLCPDIAIRYARHDRYVAVHREILKELDRHLPVEKVYSVDEAAYRVGKAEQTEAGARAMAKQIKQGLSDNVGPALRSSIGVAPSPLLAKLAAESHKPDGITVLALTDLPHRFADMDLMDIPGVGSGVRARLAQSGIHTFTDLWNIAPKRARAIWGSVQGERFWYQLHGFETKDPPVTKSMIGHSRVLTRDHETPQTARIVARALLLKAASRLRHNDMHAGALSISIKQRAPDGNSGLREDGAMQFLPEQDSYLFLNKLDTLWADGIDRLVRRSAQSYTSIRLGGVTVYLHRLCKEGDPVQSQGDLFASVETAGRIKDRARLWRAVDLLNADPDGRIARLGRSASGGPCPEPSFREAPLKKAVMLAGQQKLDLNYLGTKIAFSRVPDEAEFLY